jgi:hypothetical protein
MGDEVWAAAMRGIARIAQAKDPDRNLIDVFIMSTPLIFENCGCPAFQLDVTSEKSST